jgi:hypothetical protein
MIAPNQKKTFRNTRNDIGGFSLAETQTREVDEGDLSRMFEHEMD